MAGRAVKPPQAWSCATNVLTQYDAEGEYIEPENQKPARKNVSKHSTAGHTVSTYRYEARYEYDAPQYTDLSAVDADAVTDEQFFAAVHPEHEPLEPVPPPTPLYSEHTSDAIKTSLSPKRLLRLTPGKAARRVVGSSHDENDDDNAADARPKSTKSAARFVTVKSKVMHKAAAPTQSKRNDSVFTPDDIIDDDIAQMLKAHNIAIGVSEPEEKLPVTQLLPISTSPAVRPTVIGRHDSKPATASVPVPVQRSKASITFTAAAANKSSKPPIQPLSHASKSSAVVSGTSKPKSNGGASKPLIKVSRHLIGNAGADAFEDEELAQLLLAHNQAVRAGAVK